MCSLKSLVLIALFVGCDKSRASDEPASEIPMPNSADITIAGTEPADAQRQLASDAASIWNYCRDATIEGDRFGDVWHTASVKIRRTGETRMVEATFDARRKSVHKGAAVAYEVDGPLTKIRPVDENARRLCGLRSLGWNTIDWKQSPVVPIDAAAPNAGVTPPEGIQVTTTQLLRDYKSDETAADDKYRNRTLLVTGTVGQVGKTIIGDDEPTFVILEKSPNEVQAVGAPNWGEALKPGQTVTLRCTGKGFLLEMPILGDCTIVK